MIVEQQPEQIRIKLKDWNTEKQSVCLVPTMGFFHEGHLSLMRKARDIADKTVVSLFVNPTQFGPGEDLSNYPKDLQGDFQKADEAGVDLLFCPEADEIYKRNHQSFVDVSELSTGLCGKDRPNHFRGVTTIVTKLLNIVQPHFVIFGEKDFQQLTIIRRMVHDLNIPVEVVGHPIVREADGLAMSSRNAYLNNEERKVAVALYKALCQAKELFNRENEKGVDEILKLVESGISKNSQCSIDYLQVVDTLTLQKKDSISGNCRIVGAMKINGKVRLIDNMQI